MINYLLSFFLIAFSLPLLSAPLPIKYDVVEIKEVLDADESYLIDISENRWMCGYYKVGNDQIAFAWNPEKGFRELLEIPGNPEPVAINNSGQITGHYWNKEMRGFFWDPEEGFLDLGDLEGNYTYPLDINNHGYVVGYSSGHAFLWKEGEIIDLGTILGIDEISGNQSIAFTINDSDQIVGFSNFGMFGRNGHVKTSSMILTKWDLHGNSSEIKISPTEKPTHVSPKSLTNDGWFFVRGDNNWICNINNNARKKIPWNIDGLANQNLGFIQTGPGYFIVNGQKGYELFEVPFPLDNFWSKRGRINGMNSNGDAVGYCETHYCGNHAIILFRK